VRKSEAFCIMKARNGVALFLIFLINSDGDCGTWFSHLCRGTTLFALLISIVLPSAPCYLCMHPMLSPGMTKNTWLGDGRDESPWEGGLGWQNLRQRDLEPELYEAEM
jgi:hypothetical protein